MFSKLEEKNNQVSFLSLLYIQEQKIG